MLSHGPGTHHLAKFNEYFMLISDLILVTCEYLIIDVSQDLSMFVCFCLGIFGTTACVNDTKILRFCYIYMCIIEPKKEKKKIYFIFTSHEEQQKEENQAKEKHTHTKEMGE